VKVSVVRLKLRVRLPDGSRPYLNPIFSGNKKLKPGYAVLDGKPVHFSDGVYHLRYLKGARRVWENVNTDHDAANGEIYVVRSLSPNPSVQALSGNLFKIGFTTGNVLDRISAAKDDPTFLLAPVRPVKSYRVSNINPVKMENLLHRFFGDARLEIEITDRFGKTCKPREWFVVPIDAVDAAIKMLIDGTIVNNRYDRDQRAIVAIV
jgi:hypothetical protein